MKIIQNGNHIERATAVTDIEDRGYQFGDGIYEVTRIYDQTPFLLEEHLLRLERSAREIRMRLPFTRDQMTQACHDLIRDNDIATGHIYIQVSRGVHPRSQVFPPESVVPQWIVQTLEKPRPLRALQDGVAAKLVEDIRWLRCDIKSLNLLPNTMARQAAADVGAYEAIQHRGETVTEGAFSNVFAVFEGTVWTHPANQGILRGITRGVVLQLCRDLGIPVREEAIPLPRIANANEIMVTSTFNEVMPVVTLDGNPIGDGRPGGVTRRLQEAFTGLLRKTNPNPV